MSTPQLRKRHVPAALTSLVDRTQEVAAAKALLHDRQVRLVSLTGPPGTGKTRLALAVGEAVASDFANGVQFVALAPLTRAELVLPTIAQELGVRQIGRRPLIESLRHALRGQRLLLILDNFEHLLAGASAVVELLEACPHITALVTSPCSGKARAIGPGTSGRCAAQSAGATASCRTTSNVCFVDWVCLLGGSRRRRRAR
jgi:Cdc6-like AAA superfamily ATPase